MAKKKNKPKKKEKEVKGQLGKKKETAREKMIGQTIGYRYDVNLLPDYNTINTSTSLNYSVSIPGYSKEIHIDRREHLINILLYVSDSNTSADLQLWKEKQRSEINDVFPKKSDLLLSKTYQAKQNRAVIMINLPWSYHSVTLQNENFLNRKYIYI